MTLYEYKQTVLELLEVLTDPTNEAAEDMTEEEIRQIINDTLDGMDFNEKLENCGKLIRELESRAAAVKEEKMRLAKKQASIESSIDRIKNLIVPVMDAAETTKMETNLFKFSIRETVSVTDPTEEELALIPDIYCTITRKPNKTEIKRVLQSGGQIPGCSLTTKRGVTIK